MNLTVVIPVYNTSPEHLLEAVTSVDNQSLKDSLDIIIVDDGSDNHSTQLMLKYITNHLCNVRVVSIDHAGTSAALNHGHSLADTEYVAMMGSDDVSHPDRFKRQMAYLKAHPNTDVLGTALFGYMNSDIYRKPLFTIVQEEAPKIGYGGNDGWLVNHGTAIYRLSAAQAVGEYDIKIGRGQDVHLWKRMRANGAIFRNIPDVLYAWRRFKA